MSKINLVYFNDNIRCYRDGTVERFFRNNSWRVVENTAICKGYNRIKINGKLMSRHILINFCFNGSDFIYGKKSGGNKITVDHINGDKLDNRAGNLRDATHSEQQQNKNPKGYSFHKASNKWQVRLSIDGKNKSFGYYASEEDARKVARETKIKYHAAFTPRD